MRWRLLDRITAFSPWTAIHGRKATSLEEYSLLAPLGREGRLPESLLLESAVQLGRWLALKSSGFQSTCLLESAERFSFLSPLGMGDAVGWEIAVLAKQNETLTVRCAGQCRGEPIAHGTLGLRLVPLADLEAAEPVAMLWEELFRAEA